MSVLLARIGAPHGIKGHVRVKAFGDPQALDSYGDLFTSDGRSLTIKTMRASKSVMIVKFQCVDTREAAEVLNGCELFVPRSALPDHEDDDEFYVADLIGCAALDKAGTALGTVRDVANFGAGDLLEIAPPDGDQSWYLEFSETNVPHVDVNAKRVTICRPDEVSERDSD
ncbi:MAG: ribosome maturation factor RimM [Ahrensia sp.]|nr:ribosome maturation factor RimM [Ahrensia sp.]